MLSLAIQGLLAYFFEYFAANFMLSEKLAGTVTAADGTTSAVTGMAAAAASSAPIGDMAILVGNAVLGGSFYSTRLSIDLRKNAGLVYGVESMLQAGRTRSVYLIEYACDPQNVDRAANMAARELTNMQNAPASADELTRVKAYLLRQMPLSEAGLDEIARALLARQAWRAAEQGRHWSQTCGSE